MNKTQVIDLLEASADPQRTARINPVGNLKSFGIGLTELRKLAKKIGRDHALASELWGSDVFEARIISLLIDDPKQITREQAVWKAPMPCSVWENATGNLMLLP